MHRHRHHRSTATTFVGGKSNFFGSGIAFGSDGTLYVLDGTRAKLLTFAPGAQGNTAPIRIATLPANANARTGWPQYVGTWTPCAIFEYPSDAKSGPAPAPIYISGARTDLRGGGLVDRRLHC